MSAVELLDYFIVIAVLILVLRLSNYIGDKKWNLDNGIVVLAGIIALFGLLYRLS